jgi:hypothetical protein
MLLDNTLLLSPRDERTQQVASSVSGGSSSGINRLACRQAVAANKGRLEGLGTNGSGLCNSFRAHSRFYCSGKAGQYLHLSGTVLHCPAPLNVLVQHLGMYKRCCMQAATQAAAEFALTTEVKVSAVQQLFAADKASALAAEHDVRAKKEAECSTALKVR